METDQCTACNSSLFLLNAACHPDCPASGYFKDTTNFICIKCHYSCVLCSGGDSNHCISCKSGYDKTDVT